MPECTPAVPLKEGAFMRSMLNRLAMALVAIALCLASFVEVTSAQQVQPTTSDKYMLYAMEKKSEYMAIGLEFVFPAAGNLYAGDARQGLVPGLVSVGGIILMMSGAGQSQGTVSLGYAAYLGGRAWGAYNAYQTTTKYNAELRRRLGMNIALLPLPPADGRGVELRFARPVGH